MQKENYISINKFAQLMGVDEKTIRRAIAAGKLHKSIVVINGKNKIIPSIGKKEYSSMVVGMKSVFFPKKKLNQAKNEKVAKETKPQRQPIKKQAVQKPKQEKKTVEVKECVDDYSDNSLREAILKERVAKAKKAEIEVRVLEKSLVNKDDVYKELFGFAGEMKKKLQAIPERITDELISVADDRKTFYNLLVKSIDDVLIDLADTKNVKI